MARQDILTSKTASRTTLPLVTADDVKSERIYFKSDRENIVRRMDHGAKLEAMHVIRQRYESAMQQTHKMRDLMANWDLQYKSVFANADGEDEDRIFLPKTRESINTVRAFILGIVSRMNPIVTMQPQLQEAATIWATQDEWRRAKVAEALVQFYFSDVWKIIDDVFPRWLTHFLKYSMAIFKVSYYETDYDPDLLLDVIDRAFLYIDPNVNRLDQSRWIIEEYYIPKTEVKERIDRGDWYVSEDEKPHVAGTTASNIHDVNLQRYFGENFEKTTTIQEDEMVQCFDYWQYPRDGLGDFYATVIGGIDGVLVRYGRNPFPFKGCNYVASSFNPDDRPDGQGMCELQEPFQTVLNTFLNFRLDDVRKNIQRASFVPAQMVDTQTQQDLADGNSIVRINPNFLEQIINNGGDINKFIGELPSGTSTIELFKDLEWILGQSRESSNTPEVFQGFNVKSGTPLGIVQEQLNRTVGSFQPVVRQVMRAFERIADIMIHYFKSPEFFPTSRIVTITGQNRYEDAIAGWHEIPGTNSRVREVSPDEMANVNVTFNAVNTADAFAARTLQAATIERILQSIGQSPEIAKEVSDNISFPRLVEQMLMVGGHDINGLMLTPEEKQIRKEQQQQEQQQQMQMQQQMLEAQQVMAQKMEEFKSQLKLMEEAAKSELKEKTQTAIDSNRINTQSEAALEQMVVKIIEQKMADMQINEQEADIELDRMKEEGRIEAANSKITNVSTAGGGNIQGGDKPKK